MHSLSQQSSVANPLQLEMALAPLPHLVQVLSHSHCDAIAVPYASSTVSLKSPITFDSSNLPRAPPTVILEHVEYEEL